MKSVDLDYDRLCFRRSRGANYPGHGCPGLYSLRGSSSTWKPILTCGIIPDYKNLAILSSGSRVLLAHKDIRFKPGTHFNEARQVGSEMKSKSCHFWIKPYRSLLFNTPFGFLSIFGNSLWILPEIERSEIFGTD